MTQRDWQKDMEMFTAGVEQSRKLGFAPTLESSPYQVAIHWLQETKRLEGIATGRGQAIIRKNAEIDELEDRADAAERREQKLKEVRTLEEWHEDFGDVLWWTFPIEEPPYCGSPLDLDWPDYHTHWTPLIIPEAPAPKEGEPDASLD